MLRTELILHLTNSECYPQDEYDVPGVAQSWKNAINGHEAYVPYENELSINTWGMVVHELCIDPPMHSGYDSDYAVFQGFISGLLKSFTERGTEGKQTNEENNERTEGKE